VGNKADKLKGKLKETAGRATGDRELKSKGRDQQATGKFKESAKQAKEGLKKTV
jgi:uncharacterized protein YjbJ (UPF0337 family)